MIPGKWHIRIIIGDDFIERYIIASLDSNGNSVPVNLAGYTLEAKLIGLRNVPDIVLTTEIENSATGLVKVSLARATTTTLPETNFNWYLALMNPGGELQTYLEGDALPIQRGSFR